MPDKVQTLFTPISVFVTPPSGTVPPGAVVTIDTNVPARVYYTVDSTEPVDGGISTRFADAPVSVPIYTTSLLKCRAVDLRPGYVQESRTVSTLYTVERKNPLESFRDGLYHYNRLVRSIVDHNFYFTEYKWIVPVSSRPFTYAFVNRNPYPVYVRAVHNGVDLFTQLPNVGAGQAYEIPIRPIRGENVLLIGTSISGGTGIYDVSLYDVDVYT